MHQVGIYCGYLKAIVQLALCKLRASLQGRPLVAVALAERMGDVIACLPLAQSVREQMPDAYIVWITRKQYVQAVENHPAINTIVTVQCITVWCMIRQRVASFGTLYDLHVAGRKCTKCPNGLTTTHSLCKPAVDIFNYYSYGPLYIAFARSAGFDASVRDQPILTLNKAVSRRIGRLKLPNKYIAIHTTSEEIIRNWERQSWENLVAHIVRSTDLHVVEVGGNPLLQKKELGDKYVSVCGCSLAESIEVIRRAAAFIGIDSGPAHIANATQTPGIILLGKYRNFEAYMPYTGEFANSCKWRLIQHDDTVNTLPCEIVIAELDDFIKKTL